ncbi:MAG: thiamine-phosphate kinase [Spirochaetes bacterium RBG_16_67_19]|nr:MAG: thiamine-phosphate kinase [Spirochaetes bacterium RBG_16_67_19]
MKISELGEFGLIDRLAQAFAEAGRPDSLLIGIGDDTAAWKASGVQLITTDTLIEGTHFSLRYWGWRDLGWNALAVNVSDIGAMGGTPEQALLTLALPPDASVADLDELAAGLVEAGREYGTAIVGGDIVASDTLMVTVALIGRATVDTEGEPLLMTRDGARAGDVIAVTGYLGDSAAGLRLLLDEKQADPEAAEHLRKAHLRHRPPLAVGRMAARLSVRAAIDVSDGLLQDLGHVCRASGLGAVVRAAAVPMSPALVRSFPGQALSLACSGGEDYQLLLVAPGHTIQQVQRVSKGPVSIIGEMVADPEHRARLLDATGKELSLPAAGWDHLREAPWRK